MDGTPGPSTIPETVRMMPSFLVQEGISFTVSVFWPERRISMISVLCKKRLPARKSSRVRTMQNAIPTINPVHPKRYAISSVGRRKDSKSFQIPNDTGTDRIRPISALKPVTKASSENSSGRSAFFGEPSASRMPYSRLLYRKNKLDA